VKRVYVAGPYRAESPTGVMLNILRASRVAEFLWAKGYAVLCPHLNSALMTAVPPETFLAGDLAWLATADIIVMLPGWSSSVGATQELVFAKTHGIDIVFFDQIEDMPDMNHNEGARP